jgi:acyl-CoA thioesterase
MRSFRSYAAPFVFSHFDDDIALEPLGEGRWRATINQRWWIVLGPNGGFVAALVLRAMERTLADDSRTPRTLTLHYLAPLPEGEVTIEVDVVRSGRSLSTLTARVLLADGRPAVLAVAALSAPRTSSMTFADASAPDVPPPESVPVLVPDSPARPLPAMFDQLELRPVWGGVPFTPHPTAEVGGWLRVADGRRLDWPLLAFFTDAWFPAVFTRTAEPHPVPTVELTMHFRNRPPDDDVVLARFVSRTASEGFVEETGELWSRDGVLLVQSRQLAIVA